MVKWLLINILVVKLILISFTCLVNWNLGIKMYGNGKVLESFGKFWKVHLSLVKQGKNELSTTFQNFPFPYIFIPKVSSSGGFPEKIYGISATNTNMILGSKNDREWKSSGKFWKVLESPFLTCKTRGKWTFHNFPELSIPDHFYYQETNQEAIAIQYTLNQDQKKHLIITQLSTKISRLYFVFGIHVIS